MTGVAEIVLTKKNRTAETGDIGAFAQQLKVPGAIHGVAIHHRAFDLIIANHQFFIDTLCRILHHQGLVTLPLIKLTGGEEIDAGHLQLG